MKIHNFTISSRGKVLGDQNYSKTSSFFFSSNRDKHDDDDDDDDDDSDESDMTAMTAMTATMTTIRRRKMMMMMMMTRIRVTTRWTCLITINLLLLKKK